MSSGAASLVATVVADLQRVRQEAARRDASHSTPPVALPVALPNPLESDRKATKATRATSNGQTTALNSESWKIRQDEHTDEKKFPKEYLSESVAFVARVARRSGRLPADQTRPVRISRLKAWHLPCRSYPACPRSG